MTYWGLKPPPPHQIPQDYFLVLLFKSKIKQTNLGAESGVLHGVWAEVVGGGTCHWGAAPVEDGANATGWDLGGVAGTADFSSTVSSGDTT